MAAPEPVMILHLRKIVQVFWIPAPSQPLKSIPEKKVCRLMLTKQKSWSSPTRREKKNATPFSVQRTVCAQGRKTSKCTEKLHPNHCKSMSPCFNFQFFFWDILSRIPFFIKNRLNTRQKIKMSPTHSLNHEYQIELLSDWVFKWVLSAIEKLSWRAAL